MTTDDPDFDPLLEEFLRRGRTVRRLPDAVVARAVARAQATMTGRPRPMPAAATRGRGLALAASFMLALAGAGAFAALRYRQSPSAEPAPRPSSKIAEPARPAGAAQGVEPVEPIEPPSPAPPAASSKSQRSSHTLSPQASYAAEVELLQRAQGAFARQDFASALASLGEHARLFPHGRLAEEREALRVRSLVKSGRAEEARRRFAAFRDRFPRSVLLRRLDDAPAPPSDTASFDSTHARGAQVVKLKSRQ